MDAVGDLLAERRVDRFPVGPAIALAALLHAGVLLGLLASAFAHPIHAAAPRFVAVRLLQAGLAGLEGRTTEAVREARAVLGEYERLGLPWRQALGGLMLASVVGVGDRHVQEMAQASREIFSRLGARPFLEHLDAVEARTAPPASRPVLRDIPPAATPS